MHRLRYGDWLCGLAAAALLLVLLVAGDGWGEIGWLTAGLCALAILAGLSAVWTTATRISPTAPVLSLVAGLVLAILATLALLVDGAWAGLAAGFALAAAMFLAMRDERQPGAVDAPVDRRPAPAPTIEA